MFSLSAVSQSSMLKWKSEPLSGSFGRQYNIDSLRVDKIFTSDGYKAWWGGVLHLWRLAAASKGSSQAGSSRRTEREARWPGGPPVHTPSPLVHTSPGIRCLHSALEAHLQWQAMHADILLQSDFCPGNFLRLHFQDVSSSRAVAVGHSWERTAVSTQLVARGASGLHGLSKGGRKIIFGAGMSGAGSPNQILCMPDSSRKRANLVDRHAEGGKGERQLRQYYGESDRGKKYLFPP